MSAAAHADLLFVKEMANGDSDLAVYCKEQNIDHVPFKDLYVWATVDSYASLDRPVSSLSNKVLDVVKSVVQGQNTVGEIIDREMKLERVEAIREAKAEVTSGME
jgi:hypothetical protein